MKAFWAIIAALVLAGAALVVLGKPRATAPAPSPQATASTTVPAAPASSVGTHSAPSAPQAKLDRFEATPAPRTDVQLPPSQSTATAAALPAAPATPTPTASKPTDNTVAQAPRSTPAHAPGHTPTSAPAAPTASGKAQTLADFEIEPGDIKPQADGTTLVDGRFTIKGDGTEANPYRVPWELLVSANEVFDPSKKLNKIPQRIAMLEGKHVRLTGYVAFPLMVQRPRELLSMLNQWDGCCIGVPPTPYDAVEVKLKKAVGNKERFANAGMVQGVFRTEPYVVKNWVVGMYVLADATFTPVDAGEDPAGEVAPVQ